MHDQPRPRPYGESSFFEDGMATRAPVEGTVARGQLRLDDALYRGRIGKELVQVFPIAMTRDALLRGGERYSIYCSPCHDALGGGNGRVVQRGYRRPSSFHIDRLRDAPVGHLFDVISNGFGAMPGYAAQIPTDDRWAIVGYVRALQLSQNARESDVPPEVLRKLRSP